MDRRTALVSAASVVGVVLAGATAVGANIGILGQADNNGLGELSASGSVTATAEPEVIDVYLEPAPTAEVVRVEPAPALNSDDPATPRPQPFVIEEAGVVEVETTADGLRLGVVSVNEGWTWSADQADPGSVSVTFASGDITYVFLAQPADDGSITASVEQPIVQVIATQAPAAPAPAYDDYDDEDDDDYEEDDDEEDDDYEDDYEQEDDEDDEDDEDEDDEDDEHEGRDDDD